MAVDASELEEAAAEYERRVNVAVQSDPEVQAFVERLEQVTGEDAVDESAPLPSGDTIARDLQRFLRQRGEDRRARAWRRGGGPRRRVERRPARPQRATLASPPAPAG